MAIVVEDGSIIVGANSYVSRADYIAHAATLGITIADDSNADVELITSRSFIDQHEENLKGDRYSRDQDTSYPRSNLVIEGWSWTHEEIPRQVILCQMAFALDVHSGIDLWNPPANPELVTKSERVEGAVSVEYAIGSNQSQKLGRSSTGDAMLASLLNRSGLFSIQLVRA